MADAESGRVARLRERGRNLQTRADEARAHHSTLDLGFDLFERDASIGGGLLAGALAYRLFVLLLPTSLLLVSGLGVYAASADKRPRQVVREAGLHGLIGSQVSQTASGHARYLIFILMIPAVLYALVTLYRAIAKVYAIAWLGSARGVRTNRNGVVLLGLAVFVQLVAGAAVTWIRHGHRYGGMAALLAYVVLVGGAWLAVSFELPHRNVSWHALIPGAVLFGIGLLFVSAFNIYVTARLVEGRANTYGALGVATALLFSLVLVGRLMVVSAELNASLDDRRHAEPIDVPPSRRQD
jgi:membrane protein